MAHVAIGVVLDDDAVFGPFKGVDGAVERALPRSIVEVHGAVEDDAPRIVEVLLFEEHGHEERVDDDCVVEGEIARYAARGAPPVARPVERAVGHGERFRGEDDGRAEVGGCGVFQGRVTSGSAFHPLQEAGVQVAGLRAEGVGRGRTLADGGLRGVGRLGRLGDGIASHGPLHASADAGVVVQVLRYGSGSQEDQSGSDGQKSRANVTCFSLHRVYTLIGVCVMVGKSRR